MTFAAIKMTLDAFRIVLTAIRMTLHASKVILHAFGAILAVPYSIRSMLPPPAPLRPVHFDALRDLAREGAVEVTVRGSCMAPRIADGERVRVAAARIYLPGDVVAFQAGDGRLRVHRLLGYRPWGPGIALVTQGDHCPCHDGAIPLNRLLGRIAQPVRFADRLRAVLRLVFR
jgi:hypothetical protein